MEENTSWEMFEEEEVVAVGNTNLQNPIAADPSKILSECATFHEKKWNLGGKYFLLFFSW